jgi:hypothetical protein
MIVFIVLTSCGKSFLILKFVVLGTGVITELMSAIKDIRMKIGSSKTGRIGACGDK